VWLDIRGFATIKPLLLISRKRHWSASYFLFCAGECVFVSSFLFCICRPDLWWQKSAVAQGRTVVLVGDSAGSVGKTRDRQHQKGVANAAALHPFLFARLVPAFALLDLLRGLFTTTRVRLADVHVHVSIISHIHLQVKVIRQRAMTPNMFEW
jgi:hypothetical protein